MKKRGIPKESLQTKPSPCQAHLHRDYKNLLSQATQQIYGTMIFGAKQTCSYRSMEKQPPGEPLLLGGVLMAFQVPKADP